MFRVAAFFVALALSPTWSEAQVIVPGHLTVVDLKEQGVENAVALDLKGAIAHPLAQEYAAALAEIPLEKTVFLGFNSGGGVTDEGMKIIEILRAQRAAGRQFVSYVANGETCASMCVPIFMQSQERDAGEVSAFMFHGPYAGWTTNVPDATRSKAMVDMMVADGLSQIFVDDLWRQGVYTEPGEYWMSGRELYDAKSGLLTRIVSRHRKYEPYRAPFDPNLRPR